MNERARMNKYRIDGRPCQLMPKREGRSSYTIQASSKDAEGVIVPNTEAAFPL